MGNEATLDAILVQRYKDVLNIQSFWAKKGEQHPLWMLLPAVLFKIALNYETSMALVTFCFGLAFGMVMVLEVDGDEVSKHTI